MLPLRELQKCFDSTLFHDTQDSILPWIRSSEDDESSGAGISAHAGLAIYRNNLREGFRKTLASEFPVIERLVGEDYFRQLALSFLAEHPSRAGDLHRIGASFAPFLQERFANTQYAYLPDVALLEWTYQQSSLAADAAHFELAAVRDIPQEAYGQLCFTLHPACGLVQSPYPILRIWAMNQHEATVGEVVDLSSGADFILIRRAAEGLEMRRIAAADFAVLDAFSKGAVLAEALETASAIDPTLDLGAVLRRFIGLGVLVGIDPLPAGAT